MKIGVIGSGSWGTALVKLLTDNQHTIVWCVRNEKMAECIRTRHHNPKYLSSVYFTGSHLSVVTDPASLYDTCEIVVYAVPSAYLKSYIEPFSNLIRPSTTILSAVKGMLHEEKVLLNTYLKQTAGVEEDRYIAIMGPCHAEEVAAERLSYLTFAGKNTVLTHEMADLFRTAYLKTIVSTDVEGVQLAAVLKNVYALGAGIAHGLGYGDNFQSVLVANAAGEMNRFLSEWNRSNTSYAYTDSVYLGDLLVTCYSLYSRNRSFGTMIGKGYSVASSLLTMQMVAEGYPAAKCIHGMALERQIDLPIARTIYAILWEQVDAAVAFEHLETILC
ncbi:MAG: NAD(P)H-dependent glycerol-3-phosphate dehydrogenase [Bacteroidota bacterium]